MNKEVTSDNSPLDYFKSVFKTTKLYSEPQILNYNRTGREAGSALGGMSVPAGCKPASPRRLLAGAPEGMDGGRASVPRWAPSQQHGRSGLPITRSGRRGARGQSPDGCPERNVRCRAPAPLSSTSATSDLSILFTTTRCLRALVRGSSGRRPPCAPRVPLSPTISASELCHSPSLISNHCPGPQERGPGHPSPSGSSGDSRKEWTPPGPVLV